MIAGQFWHGSLEGSYARAFRRLGFEVLEWDVSKAVSRYARLGPLGRILSAFVNVEPWAAKVGRDLTVAAREFGPHLLIVGGASPVPAGALAQVKASIPETMTVLLWPDPLLSLRSFTLAAIPVYDMIATYSQSTVDSFLRLGARRADWVPLAYDPELHPADAIPTSEDSKTYGCDIAFVGNYRPERELLIADLTQAGFSVKVWGPVDWARKARHRQSVLQYWQRRELYGVPFVIAAKTARLNLNPIDDTAFPASNMRMFEIMGCGATLLNSKCPELEGEFPNSVATFYYSDRSSLISTVEDIFGNEDRLLAVRETGRSMVLRRHTYTHRAESLLRCLQLS